MKAALLIIAADRSSRYAVGDNRLLGRVLEGGSVLATREAMRGILSGMAWSVLLLTGSGLRAAEAEERAVRAVQALGGKVSRDDEAPGKPVTGVILMDLNVTDAGLKELAGLKQLQWLILSGTKVTDAGLKEL